MGGEGEGDGEGDTSKVGMRLPDEGSHEDAHRAVGEGVHAGVETSENDGECVC